MAVINKLRIEVALLDHLYPEGNGAHLQPWGRFSIYILREGTLPPLEIPPRVLLFETQWDLAEPAQWFAANHSALRDTTLPSADGYPSVLPRESLAQAIRRLTRRSFADTEEDSADKWYDDLYDYHERHGLQSALPGAKFPDIIIGSQHGVGEISRTSLMDDDTEDRAFSYLGAWAYTFDMNDFLDHTLHTFRRMLVQWMAVTPHVDAQRRANVILQDFAGLGYL